MILLGLITLWLLFCVVIVPMWLSKYHFEKLPQASNVIDLQSERLQRRVTRNG